MKAAIFLALCGIAGVTGTPAVRAPSMDDASPQMMSGAECMLRVLKSVHGIDSVAMGMSDAAGWSHPFLQYRAAPEPDGYRATLVFSATRDFHSTDSQPFFIADLPGVYGLHESGPPDYGTGKLAKLWEKNCRVHVMVLFI